MTSQHQEKFFEDELCAHLAAHGWLYSPTDAGYDKQRALFPADLFAYLEETQPEELAKLVKPTMAADAQARALDGIAARVAERMDADQSLGGGSLRVLRNGVKHQTADFFLMRKRPEMTVNETVNAQYAANRLRVMRQVHYSTKHAARSIDLVFFINGIPVATAELKTDFTQSIADAKKQYRMDRPPAGEPLLGFGTRALVHFAVSNDEVWMTTKLAGADTFFLPFNRGDNGHAGNRADEAGGSPTTYLWRDVLQRDQWLDIVGKFIHWETTKRRDPDTGRIAIDNKLIFPRFHQLDAVTQIVADARAKGPGQRYLIQHSAGSGKTRSIAWSAHRLATLHDDQNRKVFDSVIVVTDRTVLDDQLQEAVKQIESKDGVVATISTREASKRSFGSKSGYLASVLESGKLIIVVTLQTFPFVLAAIKQNKSLHGRSFAVIADEAHSSQTGAAASKLKEVLSAEELTALDDGGEVDIESVLAAEARAKADTHNITFLAFTATPKPKTIELFGTPDEDNLDPKTGKPIPRPFHTYTMAQAIEENFILDVLANYTSYSTAWQLAKNVTAGGMTVMATDEQGHTVEKDVAKKGLMRWVRLHPTNISQKVAIIVEHYEANVKHLLGGQAKAMVVTDSRMAAVRYKKAIDAYISKQGYTDATALVAFSGEVTFTEQDLVSEDAGVISADDKFTEASMNPGAGDLRTALDTPEYRVMIVANKFQTGFDQPKLCAMYVDKKLSGVATVQTLSRLNRYVPGKTTLVLDFVNKPEDVLADFQQFYEDARLTGTTNQNLIHDLGGKLDMHGIYELDELETVAEAFVKGKGNNALAGALQPVKQRWVAAWRAANDQHARDELVRFRKDVGSYVRLYDFMSQVLNFESTDVEKHAIFYRLLLPRLTSDPTDSGVDLSEVELLAIKQRFNQTEDLELKRGASKAFKPTTGVGTGTSKNPNQVLLDQVVAEINELFAGEDFDPTHVRTWVQSLVAAMRSNDTIRVQKKVNTLEQFLASPTLRDALMIAIAETRDVFSKLGEGVAQRTGIDHEVIRHIGTIIYRAEEDAGADGE